MKWPRCIPPALMLAQAVGLPLHAAGLDRAGSAACAACHRTIYDSYVQTPMARSSGGTGSGPMQEKFDHARFTQSKSGFGYRVYQNREGLWLEFSKADGTLHGKKRLPYFVGSGATARSYMLVDDGFLYEAPVAYYSGSGRWDLAPGFDGYAYPYLTRPILPGCLTCHASALETAAGAQNRFGNPPFLEGGVACERCHGAGAAHIAKMKLGRANGDTAIVNPLKLPAAERDSICSQCHLSGAVRVIAAGSDWSSFQPGKRLSDSTKVFVKAGENRGVTVTGHVEKLAQSACQRASGDRLWCGTCHNPHALPKPAERAAWFRGKCLGCHKTADCKETKTARLNRQDDCTACHMPKNPAVDAQHVVYTDHSIPRRPASEARTNGMRPRPDADLVAFGGGAASERDLALAYAIAAPREHSPVYHARALEMLQKVERRATPNDADDTEVLLYLAEIYRNDEKAELAIPLFERAMRLNPAQVTASVGLGGIMMERGQYGEAIRLWEDALAKNAGLELVRTNLAMAYWRSGDLRSAEAHLAKAVELSPGFAPAADLLARLRGH